MPEETQQSPSALRRNLHGLLGVGPRMPVRDNYALSVVYTPGVAEPCKEIAGDVERSYVYTWRGDAVAVIGAHVADLPRLESVCSVLKLLAGIDGVPLVMGAKPPADVAGLVARIMPTFGAAWLLALDASIGADVAASLAKDGVPVVPSQEGAGWQDDVAVYPGLFRALLDLRLTTLDAEVIAAAQKVGKEFSFSSAPAVARAAAEKAVELGHARTGVAPDAVERRLREFLETGRLRPFEPVANWLAAENPRETALRLHAGLGGTLEMRPKVRPLEPERVREIFDDGADAAAAIRRDPALADELTCKGNMVAVVTDGSAVLGLGDIGAAAGLPVMLGKAVLFKSFAGCDAVPLCVDSCDPAAIIDTVEALAPSFGGINLEDISAPRCFEIEEELKRRLDIFVFHDDQHGTAVVTLAGLLNAARLCEKGLDELTVTFNGAGAAGIAVTRLLLAAGVQDVILCDRGGPIYEGRPSNMNPEKEAIAKLTNRDGVKGTLADAVRGRHVFIGLSVAGALTAEMIREMAPRPVILAMANPVPEVMPSDAYAAGAAAVATGRSDFPNQINNCLGFPGIFRGALDVRAKAINDEMKLAAAHAIADLIEPGELRPDYFIPDAMDLRVPPAVAGAIVRSAMETGVARVRRDPDEVALRTRRFLYEGGLSASREEG